MGTSDVWQAFGKLKRRDAKGKMPAIARVDLLPSTSRRIKVHRLTGCFSAEIPSKTGHQQLRTTLNSQLRDRSEAHGSSREETSGGPAGVCGDPSVGGRDVAEHEVHVR